MAQDATAGKLPLGMQDIVLLKPYRFVPAYRNRFWSRLMVRVLMRPYLRQYHGLERLKCIGGYHLPA